LRVFDVGKGELFTLETAMVCKKKSHGAGHGFNLTSPPLERVKRGSQDGKKRHLGETAKT